MNERTETGGVAYMYSIVWFSFVVFTVYSVWLQLRKRFLELLSSMKAASPKLVKQLKAQANRRHGDDHPVKKISLGTDISMCVYVHVHVCV